MPLILSHASSVQTLPSLQLVTMPGLHLLLMQKSPTVHASPSVQARALGVWAHRPVKVSQLSLEQGFASSQLAAVPATQLPPAHASLTVQALPSLHAPLLAVARHAPVLALQLSVVQTLPSSQITSLPAHLPVEVQASPAVQALPSLQAAPALTGYTQVPEASHWSSVHTLPSLQTTGEPAQVPVLLHKSPLVHAFASSQTLPATTLFWQM